MLPLLLPRQTIIRCDMSAIDLDNSIKEFVLFKIFKLSNLRLLEVDGEPLVPARRRRLQPRSTAGSSTDAAPLLRHPLHLIEAPERASPSRLLARCAGDDGGAGAEAEAARAGGRGRGRGGGGEGKERRRGEERGDARHLLLLATRGV